MNKMNKMISNRYMIVTSLGEGGMADVYLAVDTILNREVAIKVLRGELSNDPVTLLRFQREANAASKLNHPNVVDVYDVGEHENRHYIVMEYVRGRTLKQLITQRGALDKKEAVDIMIQLTSAVDHAHENNIIHRDIKPQNVLVKDDGTIKITDFGIALAHDAVQLTQSDAVLGSAHYLAPETTRGEPATNQIDIYALGIVFYELLSGSVPFKGDNPVQIAMKHLREEIPSIRAFNPTLPQSIENIITKATVKNRKLRYPNTKDMLQDLQNCLLEEYANVDKLVFNEQEKIPTVIMDEMKQTTVEQEQNKENEAKKQVQNNPNHSKMFFGVTVGVVIGILLLVLLYFVNLQSDPEITIPDILNHTKEEALNLLKNAGFEESDIIFVEKISDDSEDGIVFECSPGIGQNINKSNGIQVSISKGQFFVIEDYEGSVYTDIEKKIKEALPNAILTPDFVISNEKKPGVILSQSGVQIGEKLEPDAEVHLRFEVAKAPSLTIEKVVGMPVESAKALLETSKVAVVCVQKQTIGMSEEEINALEKGVVIEVDPPEGTLYTQNGSENYITLYYY